GVAHARDGRRLRARVTGARTGCAREEQARGGARQGPPRRAGAREGPGGAAGRRVAGAPARGFTCVRFVRTLPPGGEAMRMTATELRRRLYSVLDRVAETGEAVEIVRKGVTIRIAPADEGPRAFSFDR